MKAYIKYTWLCNRQNINHQTRKIIAKQMRMFIFSTTKSYSKKVSFSSSKIRHQLSLLDGAEVIFTYWLKIVSKASSLCTMAPNTKGFCVDGVDTAIPIPDPGRTESTLYFWISVISDSFITLFLFEEPDFELSKHK